MSWIASGLSLAALAALGTVAAAGRRERAAEAAHPPEGRFVTVDGRRVHYAEAGAGPPLVLLHGASGSLGDFTFGLVAHLAPRYRVIAFDRPGLGWSDPLGPVPVWGREGAGPRAQAAHLARAAAALGAARPLVLGVSFGGIVALAWGLDRDPAALVLVAGVSNPWPGGLARLYEAAGGAAGGALLPPAIAAFAPRGTVAEAYARTFAPQEMPAGYMDHVGARMPLRRRVFRENARQVARLRPHVVAMAAEYDRLRLPVELVHGDADSTVPLAIHSAPLAARLPSARLTVLPGIGHMPHHAAPEAVVAAVDRAAARAAADRAGLR